MRATRDPFTATLLKHLGTQPSGYRPVWSAQITRIGVGATLAVVAVAAYVASLFHPELISEKALKAMATVAAGATFFLGYVQWHLSRHETSFDAYYNRLATVNSYIDEIGKAQAGGDAGKLLDHYWTMRVFTQLDSLEYVLGKYRLQFVNIDIVERAVRSFRSECDEAKFRQEVSGWLGGDGELRPNRLGYAASTREAAAYIVASTTVRSDGSGPVKQAAA